jgi:agmatine deiminase
MNYVMPAEWTEHERTWMAWPPDNTALGESPEQAQDAYRAWSAVANAIVDFEPVTMVVDPRDVSHAVKWLDSRVEVVQANLDDCWMRDMGPTYVTDSVGKVAAIDWVFNGWGAQEWAKWDHDSQIARFVADTSRTPVVSSAMTNEGGGIHVNGTGTVIITETVQLDPFRNPGLTRADVEAEFFRTLGVDRVVWLKRGLTRDYEQFGTRGHVDIIATFCNDNTVLYHDQQNSEHPDFSVSAEVKQTLTEAGFDLIPVPAPKVVKDDEGWVDYSYINHYVCNGAVILCGFDDKNDANAVRIMEQAYPGRKIVLVDAREIFARGGGIHCITQQQPKPLG